MRPLTRPLSFADLELQSHGVALDATLRALVDFLDVHEELVALVHADLLRGLTRPRTGRDGLNAAQVLRAFVLQRVKAWDLRELRERIADGYTLRIFTHLYSRRASAVSPSGPCRTSRGATLPPQSLAGRRYPRPRAQA